VLTSSLYRAKLFKSRVKTPFTHVSHPVNLLDHVTVQTPLSTNLEHLQRNGSLLAMNASLITTEQRQDGITILTLNRPAKRNALNADLMEACSEAFESLAQDQTQRVIILRAEGPVFCAGLDLDEAFESENAEHTARLVARVLRAVYQVPQVTIAAVQGAAIAGGAGLMSACDIVVAAQDARIGYTEVRRGLVAALVMTLLHRQVGERDARELLLLGDLISSERARQMGLVSRVVPAEHLMEEAMSLARTALQGGPQSIAQTKKVLDERWPSSFTQELDETLLHHLSARDSTEAREGIAAFLEKRNPKWQPGAKANP
jgi:methylglutaconyl-CoA hydratase